MNSCSLLLVIFATILCKYFHCCVLLHFGGLTLQFTSTIGDFVKNLAINEKKIVVNLL